MPDKKSHQAVLLERTQLSPRMLRLRCYSESIASGVVTPPGFTDNYLKLELPDATGATVMRSYTIRSWRAEPGEFELDFVVHGAPGEEGAGLASPWAQQAPLGTEFSFRGPGGGYTPDLTALNHLFVGDLSALPAIEASLDALNADSRDPARQGFSGQVIIAHNHSEDIRALETPLRVDWVVASDLDTAYELASRAVFALPSMAEMQAFIHGEAGFVRLLRRHLRVDRSVPKERLSISGYWKLGRTDENWRAEKSAWKLPVDAAEAALDT